MERELSGPFNTPDDPVAFCTDYLGFKPTEYQARLLRDPSQFIVARWSRQSGKSQTVSVLLLWLSLRYPNHNIIVLAPSLRQSKIIIRRVTGFLKHLPKSLAPKPLRTKIDFRNGSQIQALPNNPETVRGEPGVHLVYCDEFNYIADDSSLYDAVIFTLATTNGRFLATSTPGTRDSIFYRMCTDSDTYEDVSRHHVRWQDALEPNGPLKKQILEKIKRQLQTDPWRWQREMEAEFAEDEDAWIPMSLIKRCIDPNIELIQEETLLMRGRRISE